MNYDLNASGECKLWMAYAKIDFGRGSNKYRGFKTFVQDMVPKATVSGSTLHGITLDFEDPKDYTLFLLRWS